MTIGLVQKLFAILFAVLCGTVWSQKICQAEVVDELVAKKIVLVDDGGKPRAGMVMENDNPNVFVLNKEGYATAMITMEGSVTSMLIRGDDHKNKIEMGYDPKNDHKYVCFGAIDGPGRILISSSNNDGAILAMSGTKNKESLNISTGDGKTSISFIRNGNIPMVLITADGDKSALLGLRERKGEAPVAIGTINGQAILKVHDRKGSGMSMVSLPESGARLGIYRNGRPIWTPVGAVTEEDLRIRGIIKDMAR